MQNISNYKAYVSYLILVCNAFHYTAVIPKIFKVNYNVYFKLAVLHDHIYMQFIGHMHNISTHIACMHTLDWYVLHSIVAFNSNYLSKLYVFEFVRIP